MIGKFDRHGFILKSFGLVGCCVRYSSGNLIDIVMPDQLIAKLTKCLVWSIVCFMSTGVH